MIKRSTRYIRRNVCNDLIFRMVAKISTSVGFGVPLLVAVLLFIGPTTTLLAAHSGRVVWAGTDKGIDAAIVRVLSSDRKELARVEADSSGSFSIPVPVADGRILVVSILSYGPEHITERLHEFEFKPSVPIGTVQVPGISNEGATLKGKISIPASSEARVEIATNTKFRSGQLGFADKTGAFEFKGLKPGAYSVVAYTGDGTKLGPVIVMVPEQSFLELKPKSGR